MNSNFSKRIHASPSRFRDDIPEEARKRIMYILEDGVSTFFYTMINEIHTPLLKSYGTLHSTSFESARTSNNPVIEHFFRCPDPLVLDFIEICFRSVAYGKSNVKNGVVDEINNLFREYGIRFEFTPYSTIESDKPGKFFGVSSGKEIQIEYPQAIVKDDEHVHQNAVIPCLSMLRHESFKIANDELIMAEKHYRNDDFDDAITNCGKAFETVLKTICSEKQWAYDPDKDTISKLISICRENSLFPSFYAPIFETTGTIRNKLGGHGKGPNPLYSVERHHVEHAINLTCSHILLLIRMAKL